MMASEVEGTPHPQRPLLQQEEQTFTSTTAPGKIFHSRQELAQHYKTSFHKYNLKRREAGLIPINENDFNARFAAAQAVLLQQQSQQSSKASRKQQQQQKQEEQSNEKDQNVLDENEESLLQKKLQLQAQKQQQKVVEINPKQCLFDRHISSSVTKNIQRMHRKYGFFIPDSEYMIDPTGFIGYCHETIQIGNVCLYCYKQFRSATSCIQHMRNKYHTKIRYEMGYDLEYLDVFYNFVDVNNEFLQSHNMIRQQKNHNKNLQKIKQQQQEEQQQEKQQTEQDVNEDHNTTELEADAENLVNSSDVDMNDNEDVGTADVEGDEDDDYEGEEEWEDVSDDEIEDEDDIDELDDDDEMYSGYEEEVNKMGWKITPLGEIIFPDGRIVGHRGLRKYYKQQSYHKMKYEAQYNQNTSVAVIAARQASQERLYRGRVYNMGGSDMSTALALTNSENSHALALVGIAPGTVRGRAGNGLLVMNNGTNNNHAYSQVSIYRYRAAVRKQRIQQRQGQQIQLRTTTNMNKMNKKHNRLMNNVSVAHAKR